jgi:hypothetical protein
LKLHEVFSIAHSEIKLLSERGVAKLPRGSKVMPLFTKLLTDDDVYVGSDIKTTTEWVLTEEDVYEVDPDISFPPTFLIQRDMTSVGTALKTALPVAESPTQYWAAVKLKEITKNGLAGHYYVGFLLFVGDLIPF